MSVTATGLDEAIAKLTGLPAALREKLTADATDIMRPFQELAQVYGEELAGQRYQRTFRLQRGWDGEPTVGTSGGALEITKENPVAYVEHVQVNQGALFAGRWNTLDEVAEQAEPAVVDAATRSVADQLRRLF